MKKTCKQCFNLASQQIPYYTLINKDGTTEEAYICQKDCNPILTSINATACKDFFNDTPDLSNDQIPEYYEVFYIL